MRIQTKVTLLLAVLSVLTICALVAIRYEERREAKVLYGEREREKKVLFDTLVGLQGKAFEAFVNFEYSLWDEMVAFMSRPDLYWAKQNIDFALSTYSVQAAWVLRADWSPVYAATSEGNGSLAELPLPRAVLRRLFSDTALCHFFVRTPQGPLEVRGATVHPSNDNTRQTPARGYFLAGHLWSESFVREFAALIPGTVRILPADGEVGAEPDVGTATGIIAFSRPLNDWNGKPLYRVLVHTESKAVREVSRAFLRHFIVLICFSVALLVLASIAVTRWVTNPLRLISKSLALRNPALLAKMPATESEFGYVARLVRDSFEHQATLEREIARRQRVEEELSRHREHLEDLMAERTRELKQMQEELVRREKLALLGQVAGGVVHELRNPLTAIRGAVYYLKMALGGQLSKKDLRHLEIIDEYTTRADRVISAIADFTRVRGGKRIARPLREIIDQALFEAGLPEGVRVDLEFAPGLPPVKVDDRQMVVVFRNLLVNAAQAMPQGGEVRVTAARHNSAVAVTVADSGPGIAPAYLPRLFEPFFSTKASGMGLGLAVGKALVEANGGTISVESEEGRGTTFTVRLPTA